MNAGWVHVPHLVCTLCMVGLIWFVQVCHYPLFGSVGPDVFAAYEAQHSRLTSIVVMPLMLVELATACLLVGMAASAADRRLAIVGVVLLGGIWLSTFFLQVPQHTVLMQGYDPEAHRFLVRSNWVRTIGWTARGWVAMALAIRYWQR